MGKPEGQTGLAKNDLSYWHEGLGEGERGADMMRDRKEECEDFCPCSVPTQKDKLGSACSACLASVSCFDIWWVILRYQMDAAVPGALLSAECCDPWCERRAKSSLLTLLYHGQQTALFNFGSLSAQRDTHD